MAVLGIAGGSLGNLVVGITADVRDLNTKLAQARQQVERSTGEITRVTQQAGRALTAMGVAVGASMALVAKAAIDFESAFAGVRKTVEATEPEFRRLSKNLIDLSTTIPITAGELARITELAGQLGVSGVENLTKFTETVAMIGVTTNLTTEAAATAFARLSNVMNLPIEQVDRIGSAVVDLGNNFATTEQEIVNFALRIGATGNVVGLTTANVLGISAAFSSVGVRAERGGTAAQKVFIALRKAAVQGGEELEVFAETIGVTSDEFQRMVRENPIEAFTRFVEGLREQGDAAFKTLEKLQLQDQRLIQAFLALANAGDILRDSVARSDEAWEENNALTEEAQKRFGTTASQIKIMINQFKALAVEIGSSLLPVVREAVDTVGGFVQRTIEFVRDNPKTVAALAKLAALFSAIALTVGPVLIALPVIASGLAALGGAAVVAATGLKGVTGFFAFFIGFQFGTLINTLNELTAVFRRMAGPLAVINDLLTPIKEKLLTVGVGLGRRLGLEAGVGTAEAAEGGGPTIEVLPADGFEEAASRVKGAMDEIQQQAGELIEGLDAGFTTFLASLENKYGGAMANLKTFTANFAKTAGQALTTNLSDALTGIVLGTKKAGEAFKELGQRLVETIVRFVVEYGVQLLVAKAFSKAFTAFASGIASIMTSIWSTPALLATIATFGAAAAQAPVAVTGALAAGAGAAAAMQKGAAGLGGLQAGGIVTQPTIAALAERGRPEAVLPLDTFFGRLSEMLQSEGGGGIQIIVNAQTFGRAEAEDIGLLLSEIAEDEVKAPAV